MPLTLTDSVPLDRAAPVARREAEARPREWRILVPLASVGQGWKVDDPSGPQGETFVDVDPSDPALSFRDAKIREVVDQLCVLLASDPHIARAFQLLRLSRAMKREYEPAQGRVIPFARAQADRPVR